MKKQSTPNLMLTELVIVLFFFSLSAAVVLQVFIGSHNASVKSELVNVATIRVEDIVNRFASTDDADAFFASLDFEPDAETLVRQDTIGTRKVTFVLEGGKDETAQGALYRYQIGAYHDTTLLVSMPLARYIPKEGQP